LPNLREGKEGNEIFEGHFKNTLDHLSKQIHAYLYVSAQNIATEFGMLLIQKYSVNSTTYMYFKGKKITKCALDVPLPSISLCF